MSTIFNVYVGNRRKIQYNNLTEKHMFIGKKHLQKSFSQRRRTNTYHSLGRITSYITNIASFTFNTIFNTV